jgi:uncharacterized protein with PQ loop repeat
MPWCSSPKSGESRSQAGPKAWTHLPGFVRAADQGEPGVLVATSKLAVEYWGGAGRQSRSVLMTRQQFASRIRWPLIVWTCGLMNVVAMLPQLIQILSTKKVENVSVSMFIIYEVIQIGFALDGFFKRNKVLMVCMTLSAIVTMSIVCLIVYYRYA